jgi:hypothetical protein
LVTVKDPLRIPHVLDTLRRAWEAQPDLTLPQLFGVMENRGIAWNSTDDELTAALDSLIAERPARLPMEVSSTGERFLVETEQPAHRITLDDSWAAVRPAGRGPGRGADMPQPTVWRHGGLRSCAVGRPLSILDTDGNVHRFGLVSRITGITGITGYTGDAGGSGATGVTSLTGLRRRNLDGHVYHLQLAGDEHNDTALVVDRSLWIFDISRRAVDREHLQWTRLVRADLGEEVVIALQDGRTLRLPELSRITVLE